MYAIYFACVWFDWNWWLAAKAVPILLMLAAGLVSIDNGIGLAIRPPVVVKTLAVNGTGPRDCLTVVIPGYNGNGSALLGVLRPKLLDQCRLLTFRPTYGGYSERQIALALYSQIRYIGASRLNIYAESQGARVVVEMLRMYPQLSTHELILNAGLADGNDLHVPRSVLRVLTHVLLGGPISTAILRWKQHRDVRNSPQLAPDADPAAAKRAEQESLLVTGPMAFAQLRAIADADPLPSGSLAGRIGRVVYLYGANDPLVDTSRAIASWRAAIGPDTPLRLVRVAGWTGLHCPTPEIPDPVIWALTQAAA